MHQHVVVYVQAADGWRMLATSCATRLTGAVGDIRHWPVDEYVRTPQLALDYDPAVFQPPRLLAAIPTPEALGRSHA